MLMVELMTEAARRYGSGPGWGAVVADAGHQGRHGMDAPDTVQDGVEFMCDEQFSDDCMVVPRMVDLRNSQGEYRG